MKEQVWRKGKRNKRCVKVFMLRESETKTNAFREQSREKFKKIEGDNNRKREMRENVYKPIRKQSFKP